MSVPPTLITRLKSHFHSLPCGVDVILGMNGLIWVQAPNKSTKLNGNADSTTMSSTMMMMMDDERGESTTSMEIYSSKNDDISEQTRASIDRVVVCVRILADYMVHLSDANIDAAYTASIQMISPEGEPLDVAQLRRPEVQAAIVAAVVSADL